MPQIAARHRKSRNLIAPTGAYWHFSVQDTMSAHLAIDPVLTTEDVRILKVSTETIRHWERLGKLKAAKTKRGVRLFDRPDVEQLAQERERAAS